MWKLVFCFLLFLCPWDTTHNNNHHNGSPLLISARRLYEKHPKLLPATDRVPGAFLVQMSTIAIQSGNHKLGDWVPAARDYIKYSYDVVLPGTYALRNVPDNVLKDILDNDHVQQVYEDAYDYADPIYENIDDPKGNHGEDIGSDATQSNPVWGLDRVDQRNLPLNNQYNFDFTGAGVTIFVFDAGVRATHVEFSGRYTGCTDFTGEGCSPSGNHGTHVGGTALGTTYGVAKGALIHDIKIISAITNEGPKSNSIAAFDAIAAMKIANPSAKYVINGSFGGSFLQAQNNAVANCVATGVVVVLSAGNDRNDACLRSPGSTPEAITVGSTTMSDERSSFSNIGTCVDIFAPGSAILSAYNTSDTASGLLSGTSMATPHVAGIAALLLEEGLDPYEQVLNAATPDVISDVRGSPNLLAFNGYNTDPIFTAHPTPVPTPVPMLDCSPGEAEFSLRLLTDDYGVETTWMLRDDCNDRTILSGGPYPDALLITVEECISNANQYTFTIFDSADDGICCDFGVGSYEILKDGVLIRSGGVFTSQESTTFGSCSIAPTPTAPAPTPANRPSSDCIFLQRVENRISKFTERIEALLLP